MIAAAQTYEAKMSEVYRVDARWGFAVVRYEQAMTIIPPPPPTLMERIALILRAAIHIVLTFVALMAWAAACFLVQAPQLSVLGGMAIGMWSFALRPRS